jgi:hypothetical protein
VLPSRGDALADEDLLEGEFLEDVEEEFIAEFRDVAELDTLRMSGIDYPICLGLFTAFQRPLVCLQRSF